LFRRSPRSSSAHNKISAASFAFGLYIVIQI
jgi:hypothetical protein